MPPFPITVVREKSINLTSNSEQSEVRKLLLIQCWKLRGTANFFLRSFFLYFLFFHALIYAYPQNQPLADSLIKRLEKQKGLERLQSLEDIARWSSSPEEKIFYSDMQLKEATKLDSSRFQILALTNLGVGYRKKGDLEVAINKLFVAASLAAKENDFKNLSIIYTEIGATYAVGKDPQNCLEYFTKSIQVMRKIEEPRTLAVTLMNTGYEYYNQQKYDTALAYYNEAGPIFDSLESNIGLAYTIGNRALVKWKTGKIEEAIGDLGIAIKMIEPLGDEYGMADFYNHLGNIYLERNDLKLAAENLRIGVQMAKAIDLKEQVRDGSRMLSDIYRDQNQPDSAYHYLYQYLSMRDSITNEEITRELANQRADFEIGLKQAEVDVSEAKRKNQRVVIWSMVGFAMFLLFLVFLVYWFYQSKVKINNVLKDQRKLLTTQKEELEHLNGTKDKFFSIISHDLRGPINSFMGVSRLIKHFVASKKTEQLIGIADEMEKSVARLSGLLDNLLSWATQQQGHFPNVPEKVNINDVVNSVLDTFSNMAHGKDITLSAQFEGEIEVWADNNMVQTIIRNLINNALKFTPEGGKVSVRSSLAGELAKVKIEDTGVGMHKEKLDKLFRLYEKKSTYGTIGEKGLGLGLQLVHEFLELNKGTIEVESKEGKGTTFIISLPLFEKENVSLGSFD